MPWSTIVPSGSTRNAVGGGAGQVASAMVFFASGSGEFAQETMSGAGAAQGKSQLFIELRVVPEDAVFDNGAVGEQGERGGGRGSGQVASAMVFFASGSGEFAQETMSGAGAAQGKSQLFIELRVVPEDA